MRDRRVFERANDVEQLVGRPQPRELISRDLGRLAAIGRCRRSGQVDVSHVGRDLAFGLEQLGEAGEPLVRNLDHADIDGQAAEAASLGLATGQRVEDSRLAGSGEPNDRYLHALTAPAPIARGSIARGRVDQVGQRLAAAEALEVVAEQLNAPIEDAA